jgi:hypothetical protein
MGYFGLTPGPYKGNNFLKKNVDDRRGEGLRGRSLKKSVDAGFISFRSQEG